MILESAAAGFNWSNTFGVGIPILASWFTAVVAFLYTRISGGMKEQNKALEVQTRALDALLGEHHTVMEFMSTGKKQMTDLQISTAVLDSRLTEHERWSRQEVERQLRERQELERQIRERKANAS